MLRDIKCPCCGSDKVRSYDNEPLYHPTKDEIEKQGIARWDNELYMKFTCDNKSTCPQFQIVFNLTPQ